MSEVITTACSEIGEDKKFFKRINYTIIQLTCVTMVILPRPCHDLDKRSMYHD